MRSVTLDQYNIDEDEWTREDRDLLAAETADMLEGDGFDYPDEEA